MNEEVETVEIELETLTCSLIGTYDHIMCSSVRMVMEGIETELMALGLEDRSSIIANVLFHILGAQVGRLVAPMERPSRKKALVAIQNIIKSAVVQFREEVEEQLAEEDEFDE